MDAWIAALAAAFCYGVALILTQQGLRFVSPTHGASVSVPTAALFFLVTSLFLVDFGGFDPVAFAVFCAVGLLFPGTVTLLTFVANAHMGPSITGAIGNLTPLFAVLFAILVLAEPLGLAQAAGMLVIIAGVTLLTVSRSSASSSWPLWIILLPLGGAVVRGITQPGIKWGLLFWPDPLAAATAGYIISALLILTVATLQGQGRSGAALTGWRHKTGRKWFMATGLLNGIAALFTYMALGAGKVSIVAPLIATYPLVTLIISAFILRTMVWNMLIGTGVLATVVGVGIILAGA